MTTEKKKAPVWVWVLLVFIGLPMTLCTVGIVVVGVSASKEAAEAARVEPQLAAALPVTDEVPAPAAAPKATPQPTGPRDTIPGNGTFLVGKDIAAGTYRGEPGSMGMCYWSRLKGLSGEIGDIIANEAIQGPSIVTIKETDKAFQTQHCASWKLAE